MERQQPLAAAPRERHRTLDRHERHVGPERRRELDQAVRRAAAAKARRERGERLRRRRFRRPARRRPECASRSRSRSRRASPSRRRTRARRDRRGFVLDGPEAVRRHRRTRTIERAAGRHAYDDLVGEVEAEEHGLDRVVAARFAGEHAEQQVELRLRRNAGDRAHADSPPAVPISLIVNPIRAK